MAFNKTDLTKLLTENAVSLTYTSAETGITKTFRASLRPADLLPTKTVREAADDTIVVVNLEKTAWRSLKIANISNAVIAA